jgi:ADP-heptose:LPS heptosyltransferase
LKNSAINWQKVNRILIVRLRSIGDTVLSTPSIIALRRFLPNAQIDILLEDWCAPVLDGLAEINNVLTVGKTAKSRINTAWEIRRNRYDVVFNLHGGTTATFFVRASGAKHRVGLADYQYSFLYNHLVSSSAEFWQQEKTHSAEQQLALLGGVGVPVNDRPKSRLNVSAKAKHSLENKLAASQNSDFKFQISNPQSKIQNPKSKIALVHPVAAFDTKQWAIENFARVAEFLDEKGFRVVAVATPKERETLEKLQQISQAPITIFDDLTLPEITALAEKAEIFVGNDSGIAHIAAAVQTRSVVIFGSSNRAHWRPWTDAPHQIVYEEFDCQPCHGYFCAEYDEPKCILIVKVETVRAAIDKVFQVC